MSRGLRTFLVWLGILAVAFLGIKYILSRTQGPVPISYTQFVEQLNSNNVKEVVITDREVVGSFKEEVVLDSATGAPVLRFKTMMPAADPALFREMVAKGVEVRARAREMWWDVFMGFLPWAVILGVIWFFFMRQVSGPADKATEFSRARAKIMVEKRTGVTFDDVAGVPEAKEELRQVIDFLKNPEKYRRIGAKIPKGVLLVGAPGTGKTLLAKAVAGEAGVPFLSISGSDFVELFVGVGAARVRDLFRQAKQLAPCIVFIDELDAVGRMRGAGLGGGHDEREQTLNQLLVEMDGFDTSRGVVIMAATNRPDILDPALLRPGRFDRKVVVDVPDVNGRYEILKIHTRRVPLDDDVDLMEIARSTPGMTGADLENLVNEAALLAARDGKTKVSMREFEEARDKILMGAARRSLAIPPEEKKRVAYHEAGHAIVARFTPKADPIHKITIIPRGLSLGATVPMPEEDRRLYTEGQLRARLRVLMGGREAELLVFGEESTGAAQDLAEATDLARKMVAQWGMSDRLGPLVVEEREGSVFLGKELVTRRHYSEKLAELVDEEVARLLAEASEDARKILVEHRELLDRLVAELMEKETLGSDELRELWGEYK